MKEQQERSGSKQAKDDVTKDSNVQAFKRHAFSFSILSLSLLPSFSFFSLLLPFLFLSFRKTMLCVITFPHVPLVVLLV